MSILPVIEIVKNGIEAGIHECKDVQSVMNGIVYFNEIHLIKAIINLVRQPKNYRKNRLAAQIICVIFFNARVDLNFSRLKWPEPMLLADTFETECFNVIINFL